MQLWPIDVLGEVFKFMPSRAHILGGVCKRFKNAVNTEEFWALRLKTRFNITALPAGHTYRDYYKLCFGAMQKLKHPLIPTGQVNEGGAKGFQNGFALTMTHRVDDFQILELDKNVVRLKKGTQEVMRWVLNPSAYFLDRIINEYWLVRSQQATYLLNTNSQECVLLANARLDVSIRHDLLFTIGETTLNVQNLKSKEMLFMGVVFFNNKRHLYSLTDGEIAFVTNQNKLVLVNKDFKVIQMPCFFEPQDRLNESQLIVKIDDNSFLFDLNSLQLIPINLGVFSFKADSKVAFVSNNFLTVCEYPNLHPLFQYPLPFNYDILKLDPRFVLLKPTVEPQAGRSQFRIIYLNEKGDYPFNKRKMTYIGSEAFFILFARLSDSILEISCLNALTLEYFTPVRLIQNFQFRSAVKISPYLGPLNEDYLVVSYVQYMIKVKAVLRSCNGDYKITTYQYNY